MLANSTPASADAAAEAALRWGLEGVWQIDCGRSASKDNQAVRFIVRSGKLYLDRDIGAAWEANLVSYAERASDGMLELTILFPPPDGARTLLLKRENANQLMVWSNRRTGTDDYTIRDGASLVDNNRSPPLLTHCSRYGGT